MPDLSTQLRDAVEAAAAPVTLDEILLGEVESSPTPSTAPLAGRRYLAWWASAAVVALVLAGAFAVVSRPDDPRNVVETPDGRVAADAFPAPGEECGGSRVGDGLSFAGPESADACIGVAPVESGATTIYVTSADGVRIYGGWVLDGCGSALSATGQIELGNDSSPVLMMGAIGADVAAVQYRLRDGTLLTAQTGEVAGVTHRRFYALRLPANAPIADEVFLASDGSEVDPPVQRCQPPQMYLPDDVVVPLVASYIAESSEMMGGVRVGDPCFTGEVTATPPMSALIDGNINTPECIVVGWMPHSELPGIPPGYYGHDGSILWNMTLQGEDPPTDLRERALEWAAAH